MSYSSRRRYKTRREKNAQVKSNTKRIIIALILIAGVIIFENRRYIWDYIRTSMY